jgi:chromosome segregation ATPase
MSTIKELEAEVARLTKDRDEWHGAYLKAASERADAEIEARTLRGDVLSYRTSLTAAEQRIHNLTTAIKQVRATFESGVSFLGSMLDPLTDPPRSPQVVALEARLDKAHTRLCNIAKALPDYEQASASERKIADALPDSEELGEMVGKYSGGLRALASHDVEIRRQIEDLPEAFFERETLPTKKGPWISKESVLDLFTDALRTAGNRRLRGRMRYMTVIDDPSFFDEPNQSRK